MLRRLLTVALVLGAAATTAADEKADVKKLNGSWAREVEGTKLVYHFKDARKMVAELTPAGVDKPVKVEVDYKLDKDGVLSGEITKVEAPEGAEGLPSKGDKFTFKVEVGKETLIVSDFKGIEGDQVKKLVEGEYKKK